MGRQCHRLMKQGLDKQMWNVEWTQNCGYTIHRVRKGEERMGKAQEVLVDCLDKQCVEKWVDCMGKQGDRIT